MMRPKNMQILKLFQSIIDSDNMIMNFYDVSLLSELFHSNLASFALVNAVEMLHFSWITPTFPWLIHYWTSGLFRELVLNTSFPRGRHSLQHCLVSTLRALYHAWCGYCALKLKSRRHNITFPMWRQYQLYHLFSKYSASFMFARWHHHLPCHLVSKLRWSKNVSLLFAMG